MDLDLSSLKMPDRLGVNYDEHISKGGEQHEVKPIIISRKDEQQRPAETR
jgi:hypothetical protein